VALYSLYQVALDGHMVVRKGAEHHDRVRFLASGVSQSALFAWDLYEQLACTYYDSAAPFVTGVVLWAPCPALVPNF